MAKINKNTIGLLHKLQTTIQHTVERPENIKHTGSWVITSVHLYEWESSSNIIFVSSSADEFSGYDEEELIEVYFDTINNTITVAPGSGMQQWFSNEFEDDYYTPKDVERTQKVMKKLQLDLTKIIKEY